VLLCYQEFAGEIFQQVSGLKFSDPGFSSRLIGTLKIREAAEINERSMFLSIIVAAS